MGLSACINPLQKVAPFGALRMAPFGALRVALFGALWVAPFRAIGVAPFGALYSILSYINMKIYLNFV